MWWKELAQDDGGERVRHTKGAPNPEHTSRVYPTTASAAGAGETAVGYEEE
jgi:hypothetical protein